VKDAVSGDESAPTSHEDALLNPIDIPAPEIDLKVIVASFIYG
jgi:hypothetical protein